MRSRSLCEQWVSSGKLKNPTTCAGDPIDYVDIQVRDSVFLEPMNEAEITDIINSLKNSSAAGLDEIKAEPIKMVASMIAVPLTRVQLRPSRRAVPG